MIKIFQILAVNLPLVFDTNVFLFNVTLTAGKDYHQTGSEILSTQNTTIQAQEVLIDAAQDTMSSREHNSDLKVGTFARVKSPLLDLLNLVDTVVNTADNASDRTKAANALGLAAKGYTVASTIYNATKGNIDGTLLRAEAGFGVAHSRSNNLIKEAQSQGNTINGKNVTIEATAGNLTAINTSITGNDKNAERMAQSAVNLSAKNNIHLMAGESTQYQQGKQTNAGVEVGTAFSIGAKTGWSIYLNAGYGNSKQKADNLTHNNTYIDSETVNLQSGKDTHLMGAGVTAKTINVNSGGNLYIESLQDRESQRQSSQSAGLQLEFGLGSAWSFSLSGSSAKGTARRNQVNEQSGLYAEDGGYHINADNIHLKGGVIASTSAENSELSTNRFTFEDIQNESDSQATSLSGSVGMSRSSDTLYDKNGKVISNPTRAQYADKTLKREKGETSLTGGIGIPLHESQSDSSLTKATLTEGKITLNKDSQPTQTTAKALGINTEIKNANEQVENTLNLDRTLQEQTAVQTAVANLQEAAKTYVANKRQDAQAEFDKVKQQHNKDSETYKAAEAAVKAWEIGGKNKQNIDTVTAVVSTVLAGSPAEQIAVAALSPTLNNQIHALTKDDNSKVTNILAHAVLGAIEAKAAGANGASGAVAAAGAELIANTLAKELYGVDGKTKTIDGLTQEKKQNILALSQIGSAIASGMTADSGYAVGVSGEIGKRAVENNYLSKQDWQNYQSEIRQCGGDRSCVNAVNDKYEKIDQENSKNIEIACKLGGNSESCKAQADLAYEGASYGAKYVYTSNYTGWDNAWLSNHIESSYSDSQLTPSVALLGDETLAKLITLAKDKEFVASLENDKSKQEQFRTLVDQSVVAIRTENGAAYEFSGRNLSSPLSELEKITGRYDVYNKETPLEPVIFEDLLVGGGFKLTNEGLSFTAKKLTSAGEKWASGMATDEMLTLGVAAEIHFSKALEKLLTSSSAAVGNVFKAASDAPMKTTVANIGAAGSVITTNEAYKYIRSDNPLPLTKENLINSSYDIGVEISKAALWGNMPWYMGIAGNIATDSVAYGKPNVADNISYGISGEAIDRVLPNVPNATYIREASLGLIKYIQPKVENSPNDK